ncbi:MAG: phosphoenolpyruvate-utilizing N-terminal domain-containing protein, partial [Lutispora sp.]|nr:phosphoenolpyruvate-utilizing N-terminal domain-containing protein [Lutispora sp.]
MLKGTVASLGIAMGEVYLFEKIQVHIDYDKVEESEINKHENCFREALEKSKEQIAELIESLEDENNNEKSEILKSHLIILEDNTMIDNVLDKILYHRHKADAAVALTLKELSDQFANIEDEYIKERLSDIKDICNRIIYNIKGVKIPSLSRLAEGSVIIANELTPSDTASIDKRNALAFATELGGKNSHIAIMAGLLEIPAIVGVRGITKNVKNGDHIIVDANEGIIIINPDEEQKRAYYRKKADYENTKKEYDKLINVRCVTKDNKHIEISGNIGKPADVDGVLKYGADGIGLFRTEFLYMDRGSLPDEEE